MKCIKKGKVIKRVADEQAYSEVKKGWAFCPKSEWKTKVRDVKRKSKKAEEASQKAEEASAKAEEASAPSFDSASA